MSNIILDCTTEAQIRAAWDAIPANVVESGNTYEILLDKPEIFLGDLLNFDGKITGPSNGIVLASGSGKSYLDNPDMQNTPFVYSAANGASLRIHGANRKYLMRINVPYMTLRGIQLFQSAGDNETAITVDGGGSNLLIDRCIIDNAGQLRYCKTIAVLGGPSVRIISSLIVHRSNQEMAIYLDSKTSSFENVTFARPSNFTQSGEAVFVVGDSNKFINCNAVGFDVITSKSSARVENCAYPGTTSFGTNNKQNVPSADQVISTLNDFRTKPDSLLVDAGISPSADNAAAPNGNRQQGTATDIGAWEKPSESVAPTARITNVVISGTNNDIVTITGVTTGNPTSAEMLITPVDMPYNKAVGQGPKTVTLTTNAFTVEFQSVKVGAYALDMPVRNTSFSTSATNDVGNFEITGAKALTVVQESISGQMYKLRGTTSGNPTSASLYLPPDATNPEGAVGQTIPVNLTPGAFEASQSLPAGNYDAGLLTFTNAQGTSFPQPGTFPVSIIGIDGNPELPGDDDQAVPTVTSVTVSPSTANGSTQFTAAVVGENFPDQNVMWSATGGTVNAQGMFTAPAPTSSERVIVVTATSVLDPNKSGSASVTIAASNEPVDPTDPTEPIEPTAPTVTSVEVSPSETTISTVFTATVQGVNSPPTDVTWVSEPPGFVSATGVFTAPAPSGVVQRIIVTAYSTFDPMKYDTAVATIPALTGSAVTNVVINPSASTVAGGEKLLFGASVIGSGGPSQEVTWSSAGGSIGFDGLFTAPPAAIFSQSSVVTARSVQNPAKFATATVTTPAVSYEDSNPSYAPLRHFDSNITNKFGVAVEGAEVHVRISQTGDKAVLYADKGKTRQIFNPILTDDEGYFEFYVESYQCDYTVKGSGLETFTRKDIFDIINNVDLGPIYLALDGLNKRLLVVESGVGNPPVLVVKFPWEN